MCVIPAKAAMTHIGADLLLINHTNSFSNGAK